MAKYSYFNRDISWLSFNYRVLEEAYDKTLPLYERIKFLAIYSNNLEEFYRVRVSYYRGLLRELPPHHPKIKSINPSSVINQINTIVGQHQKEFNDLFYNQIIPELRKEGINLYSSSERLTNEQKAHLDQVFSHEILTSIQPIILIKNRIKPFLKTGHIYLVLKMYTKTKIRKKLKKGIRPTYGLLKLPTDHGISRFIELPDKNDEHCIMFLEDVIMRYIDRLYPGYFVDGSYPIKVTRDADLEYEDFDGDELIEVIENLAMRRAIGAANRFQYDTSMSKNTLRFIIENLDLSENILVKGGKTHNFRDFFSFPNPLSPKLEIEKSTPLRIPELDESKLLYKAIEQKDFLLHFPYQSFDYFISFLNEAAIDDEVIEIRTTQYRVASKSAVVDALINAAINGKNVSVFVELKARFDEEANLEYAQEMKKAGIKIIYSIPGLKVHAKVALIKRKNKETGKESSQVFLGTGNFNEKTAKLYCDHGFFTSDEKIVADLNQLFKYLEDQSTTCNFKKLLIASFNLVDELKKLVHQEIQHVKNGKKGYILLKMNGLEDPKMIDELYAASEAGVKIDLIVRGVCKLIPGKKYSKNIRVIRIVDMYLEHARVFYFNNNGDAKLYMGSADWMRRNLYRRIECVFPVTNPKLIQETLDMYNVQLKDNVKARIIDSEMNSHKNNEGDKPIRAQIAIYDYLKGKLETVNSNTETM